MPFYNFKCKTHGMFEVTVSMPDIATDVPQLCPTCNDEMVRKFHSVRRVYRKYKGHLLDPDMNPQQAEDVLYDAIEETEDDGS